MDVPLPPDINIGDSSISQGVKDLIESKYNTAIDWAQYAATQLEGQLANLNNALTDSDLKAALATLKNTLDAIPTYTPSGAVTYQPVGPVTFDAASPYVAPAAPVYGTFAEVQPEIDFPAPSAEIAVSPYVAPTLPDMGEVIATLETPVAVDRGTLDGEQPTFLEVPTLAAVTIPTAPVMVTIPEMVSVTPADTPNLLPIPVPIESTLPTDPTIEVFTDMGDVSAKLEAYHNSFMNMLASVTSKEDLVGVSAQVTTMLAREQAVADAVLTKLNNQLTTTIGTITAQFAARGFDMPPGALTAQITEANTQAQYTLADATASLGREMIGIEGQIITAGMSANASLKSSVLGTLGQTLGQWSQAYTAYFDRGLRYVMEQAQHSLETFKAKVQAQLTLIDANKAYIQATAQYNDASTAVHTNETQVNVGKLETNRAQIAAASSVNTALEGQFSSAMKVNSDILGVNREQVVATNTINASLQEQFADKMKVLLTLMSQDITIGTNAAAMNKAKAETHLSELDIIAGGDKAQMAIISGQVEANSKIRSKDVVEAQYTAEKLKGHIDTIAAKYKLVVQENEGKFNIYDNESKGKMLDIQAEIELLKGQVIAGEYNLKDAYNLFTSLLEVEKMKQVDGEQQIKRAQILSELGRMATQIDIEYAGKELQAEIAMAGGMTSAFQQMIAAALNGVSVSTSMGAGYSASSSHSVANNTTDSYGSLAEGATADHANPTLARL